MNKLVPYKFIEMIMRLMMMEMVVVGPVGWLPQEPVALLIRRY